MTIVLGPTRAYEQREINHSSLWHNVFQLAVGNDDVLITAAMSPRGAC